MAEYLETISPLWILKTKENEMKNDNIVLAIIVALIVVVITLGFIMGYEAGENNVADLWCQSSEYVGGYWQDNSFHCYSILELE